MSPLNLYQNTKQNKTKWKPLNKIYKDLSFENTGPSYRDVGILYFQCSPGLALSFCHNVQQYKTSHKFQCKHTLLQKVQIDKEEMVRGKKEVIP